MFSLNRYIKIVNTFSCSKLHKSFSTAVVKRAPVKLAYTTYHEWKEPDSGPPLIVIHGLLGQKKNWRGIALALSKKEKRQVICVDCRNHGESPHTPTMSIEEMTEDIELLMSDLDIPRAVVLGHSMGGKIAMTLALTKPKLVSGLIVEDTAPLKSETASIAFPAYIKAMQDVDLNLAGVWSMSDVRGSVDRQLKKVFTDANVRSFILTNIEEKDGKYQWIVNLDAIQTSFNDITGFPQFKNSYYSPTLFIGGDWSQHIKRAYYPEINRLFPNVDIKFIKEAGHWVHSEQPHAFMGLVQQFMEEHSL